MVKQVDTLEEFDAITKGEGGRLVVVDFFATWCGPCQTIAPVFQEFETTYADVVFIKVDVDKNDKVAEKCKISAMPTFQFYKGGKMVDEIVGASRNSIEEKIKQLK